MPETDTLTMIECQRCGRGFLLTATYRGWLAKRGIVVHVPTLCRTCFAKLGSMPKQHGKVKWFNPKKRFGFIVRDSGQEIFFHQRQIVGDEAPIANDGQQALFHVRDTAKGPEALNVELGALEETPQQKDQTEAKPVEGKGTQQ